MGHAKNQHVLILDTINYNVLAHGKTPCANAEVVVAGAAQVRMAGQEKKAVGDGIDQAVCDLNATAFFGDVVQVAALRDTRCAISATLVAQRRGGLVHAASLPRRVPAWIAA